MEVCESKNAAGNKISSFCVYSAKAGLRQKRAGDQHTARRPAAHHWCHAERLRRRQPEVRLRGRSCLLPRLMTPSCWDAPRLVDGCHSHTHTHLCWPKDCVIIRGVLIALVGPTWRDWGGDPRTNMQNRRELVNKRCTFKWKKRKGFLFSSVPLLIPVPVLIPL